MKPRATSGNQIIVGRRLRASRKALRLTQLEAADQLNTSSSAVSMWESGDRLLDVTRALQFADRNGLTLDWLFGGKLAGVRNDLVPKLVEELGKLDQASMDAAANPKAPAKPKHGKEPQSANVRTLHRRA